MHTVLSLKKIACVYFSPCAVYLQQMLMKAEEKEQEVTAELQMFHDELQEAKKVMCCSKAR